MTRIILAATFIFCTVQASLFCNDFSDVSKIIENITEDYPQTSMALDGRKVNTFSQEEMLDVVNTMVSRYSGHISSDAMFQLTSAHSSLINQLREYSVTGIGFALDPNIAIFWDQQNPAIEVCYKNYSGDLKYRTYQAYINSFGFKLECALKINIMLFTDTDFNFYDSNKKITIGSGIDITLGFGILGFGVDLTYAQFRNAPGGVIILGYPLTLMPIPGISIVTGGILQPIN